jgi:MraZ protein
MMLGRYKCSIDSKNRLCIPLKLRGTLGGKCVISRDLRNNCLNLYTTETWRQFTEKIENLPTAEEEMDNMRMLVYSNSDEMELDAQGRIILSPVFCKNTKILVEKEVSIIGQNSHAKIWSVSEWEETEEALITKESRGAINKSLKEKNF